MGVAMTIWNIDWKQGITSGEALQIALTIVDGVVVGIPVVRSIVQHLSTFKVTYPQFAFDTAKALEYIRPEEARIELPVGKSLLAVIVRRRHGGRVSWFIPR